MVGLTYFFIYKHTDRQKELRHSLFLSVPQKGKG